MGNRRYSDEYVACVVGPSGREHTVAICVEYNVENCGGIGFYEFWGHTEYDGGKPCICNELVTDAWVDYNGKSRRISTRSWVAEDALEDFRQNWEWEDVCDD